MAVLFVLLAACGSPAQATLVVDTGQDQVEIEVEVADTHWERARGLMGRQRLDPDAGMVFVVASPTETPFWMKDTLIPLSVAFWNERGRIFRIRHMEPCPEEPCPFYEPGAPWIGAVEVNQGYFEQSGIGVGAAVRLER